MIGGFDLGADEGGLEFLFLFLAKAVGRGRINLIDFDQSSPDALTTVHVLVESVQRQLSKYAATVKEVTAGDKGAVMIVVFGAPPHTHEDDATRCTHAALPQLASPAPGG